MEKKHFNSKHDDATWRALFRGWHAGETSRALRAEAGVAMDTWRYNARRLKLRIKDLPADDPRRRRVPAYEARAGEFRHPKGSLDERDWLRVMALRAGGVKAPLLAEVFGVKPNTIWQQAKARGLPPPHLARRAARDEPRPEMAFVFDRDDPEVTRKSLGQTFMRAVKEERYEDAEALGRMWDMIVKIYQGMPDRR